MYTSISVCHIHQKKTQVNLLHVKQAMCVQRDTVFILTFDNHNEAQKNWENVFTD